MIHALVFFFGLDGEFFVDPYSLVVNDGNLQKSRSISNTPTLPVKWSIESYVT